ncbi:unnamed protein product [Chilo suppressalis]|uniref:Cytadhesion n=1 Tax=Chilo suppressalis TaxID=168631 RepID=A0ABN8AQ95_CHISP|nr:unnamed protein product [Chilo suppressalis]
MDQIRTIPNEILNIIPKFGGEQKSLNFFLRKCEYVIRSFRTIESPIQDLYVFHSITSRLVGKAAELLSEREDVETWDELRTLLSQHFGDPRSEACIAIELETIKIKPNESLTELCHRIQNTRSALISKVNLISDQGIKAAKLIIYNNTALNVFLYNLPEDMIRIVRLKGCTTLEEALSIVTEEENFQFQYNSKNKKTNTIKPLLPQLSTFRPNFMPSPTYKFGIPQNKPQQNFMPTNKFNTPNNNFKFGISNQLNRQPAPPAQNNCRPVAPSNPNFRQFGNNFPYNPQQRRFGYFNNNTNPQFKFGVNNPPLAQRPSYNVNTDVSMRSAAPIRQNMINPETEQDIYFNQMYEQQEYYDEEEYSEQPYDPESTYYEPAIEELDNEEISDENFQIKASTETKVK